MNEMVAKGETKARILDTAENLFAEYGFKDTSLRQITSKAGVNLASVNYHYGDKKTLIRAVLERYLDRFMPAVESELMQLRQHDHFTMLDLFRCFKKPLLELDDYRDNGTATFMSLIGRGYTDVQGHLRWFIVTRYHNILKAFTDSLLTANPSLDPETLFWRLHFTLGTSVFTMASSTALCEIAQADFDREITNEDLIERLLPYLAAGMSSGPETTLTLLNSIKTGTQ